MIFGKKFVTVINKIRGGARFDSIIKTCDIIRNKEVFLKSYPLNKKQLAQMFRRNDIRKHR